MSEKAWLRKVLDDAKEPQTPQQLQARITTLLAVIEQCESVINQANEALPSPEFIKALRAIKKVKSQ